MTKGWLDAGQTLGVPKVTHPISGEEKAAFDNDTITAFARRHGWEVKEQKGPDDYLTEVWLHKDDDRVCLYLWPGRNQSISTALINGLPVPRTTDLRNRVEKYLAGVPCPCGIDAFSSYERVSDPTCAIHGQEEAKSA